MQVTLSREILGSKQTQVTTAQEFTTESDFEQLEHYQSTKWDAYEEQIRLIQQSMNIVPSEQIEKIIQKEGITININQKGAIVEFQNNKPSQIDNSKMQQVYEKVKAQLSQETQTIKLSLTQKQSEVKILLNDLNSKSLEIGKLNAANKLSQDQSKRDILRLQNQNKLLNEQVNRLKLDLSSSIKTNSKPAVSPVQQYSLTTQTDFQNSQILVQPRRPGVQILKITSSAQSGKKLQTQFKQTGSSPIKYPPDSSKKVTTPTNNKPYHNEQEQSFMEQNKYLRQLVHKFTQQLQQSKKSPSPNESRVNSINSSDVITLRNRIAELESKNRILENEKQRVRGELSIKQSQYRSLQNQLKIQSPMKVISFKKQQPSINSKANESINKQSRQLQNLSNSIVRLQNQNRDLQRKLEQQKRQKGSQTQKYQLQINKITNELKNANDQKSSIQKQLSSAKSVASFDNYSKQDSQRRIRQLETQVQSLRNQRNNTSNRYVSSSSYEFLKQQHEKQKKSLNQARDKARQQITNLTTNYNKLMQQNVQTKNQKQRIQGQINRIQLQKTRIDTQLQKLRTQNQNLNKKIRSQQSSIQNSNSLRSFNQTQQQKYLKDNSQFSQQLRKVKQQNQKLKQMINEYKQILNNRNLTVLNDQLHTYQWQLKQKSVYINTLENNLADKDQRIQYLQNDNQNLRSKVTSPRNEFSGQQDWIDINGELEYQQKMTEKLSQHVKQLKIQNQNFEQLLDEKENIINLLNQRLAELSNPNRFNNDISRGNLFNQMENQYNQMLSRTRDRTNRLNNRFNVSSSNQVEQLLAQVENYKNKYQKALQTSNYLRQCIYQTKKTNNIITCSICLEYQQLVSELQRRINIYQVMMMSELRRMFVNCESRLNETGYSWLEVENIIFDLRTRTLNHRPYDTFSEEHTEKYMEDSPIALQRTFEKSRRAPARTQRRLDELIKYDNVNQQSITVLLLRITEAALLEKPKFILPDYVYILYLDPSSPSKMKIELVQIKQIIGEDYKQYLSPQVINGEDHTSKSLVWNLGIIFNLILNRKSYFKDQKDILDKSRTYRYDNRAMPNFKYILQSMLERQPNRRSTLQKVYELLKIEEEALME